MYLCLPNIINPTYNEQLREMVPPTSQNNVGLSNKITLLSLYYMRSRLVTLLKVNDAPAQVSDIFHLTVSFKLINYSFQIFLPKGSIRFMPYIV